MCSRTKSQKCISRIQALNVVLRRGTLAHIDYAFIVIANLLIGNSKDVLLERHVWYTKNPNYNEDSTEEGTYWTKRNKNLESLKQ